MLVFEWLGSYEVASIKVGERRAESPQGSLYPSFMVESRLAGWV